MNPLLLFLYGLIVSGLLVAELREDSVAQKLLKPLAALGFVLLALYQGALETDYGLLILTGLCACALGDILLLSRKSTALFKSGMGAFALGHLFYILAANLISHPTLSLYLWLGSFLAAMLIGYIVFKYLKPYLPKEMLWPVGGYVAVIVLMCAYATQSDFVGYHALILPAAILFAISDIFVARDRFIKPNPKNAWVITPFYFTAQALFALSVTV